MHPEQGFELRPRTIGELLDLIFRIYRRGFKVFAVLGVVVTACSAVLGTLIQAALVDPSVWVDLQRQSADPFDALGQIYLAAGVSMLVNVFIYGLGLVSITATAEDTLLGRPLGVREALAKSWRRAIWAAFASVLLLVLLSICAIPCLVPAIPVLVLTSLTVPLVYLERKGPIAAMKRSFELVAKRGPASLSIESNWVRIVVVGFVTLLVVYMLSLLVGLPLIIASGAAAFREGGVMTPTAFGPQVLPLHLQLPLQLVTSLLQGLFLSLGIIPWTVIYYDIRTRHEGLDLEIQTQDLGRDGPATTADS